MTAPFDGLCIRTWVAHGLNCAIMWGGRMGHFNGYVQLPPHSADRVLAEVYEIVDREERAEFREQHGLPPEPTSWTSGYDALDVDAPGGLTYGPNEDGWVGFDTAHYNDYWSPEVQREILADYPTALVEIEELRRVFDTQELNKDYPFTRAWTLALLVTEVEHVAQQLAERNVVRDRKRTD
jgi:hypothetical protein